MTLDQIRYFLEVAYCRSFSEAARHLYISQPNLTKYIAGMEKELGTKLFERTTRHVELTEYGQQLMNRTETLFMPFLRAYEDMETDIRNKRHAVLIGISRDEQVPAAFTEILRRRNLTINNVRYIPTYDNPDKLISGLRSHQYNLIVSSDRNARAVVDTKYIKLQPLHMLLAISRQHPLAEKQDLIPSDLRDEIIFFAMPKGIATSEEISQILFRRIDAMVNVKLVDAPGDALSCVQVCAGAAILPDLVNRDAFPDIRFLPFPDRKSDPAFQSVVWRTDETDRYVTDLTEELRTAFPGS